MKLKRVAIIVVVLAMAVVLEMVLMDRLTGRETASV